MLAISQTSGGAVMAAPPVGGCPLSAGGYSASVIVYVISTRITLSV